ncbi:acyltransferase [Amycolatopsis pigmentata]|uniref:Acyltransferase n=1 Tax=Amycolatopsis pigmentata TaxID=450801 RepID=A0ABW5G0E1_9PSEU
MSQALAREHLHYVDMIRVLTIGLVIGTHVLALEPIAPTIGLGAVTIVFHVSREVFFLLTAFVLTYSTTRRKPHWPSFWRKRFLFVAVPYLTWTVLYFLADGPPLRADVFWQDLLTGTARYHLYFLLVSMQIYLVFPLIRELLRATRGRHGAVLAACAAFQVLFSLFVQKGWTAGVLTGWLHFPDALLPSYLGYVVAGAIAGEHREELVAWTRANFRLVLAGCWSTIFVGVGIYAGQVFIGGETPLAASGVWQPAVVVESAGIAWAFLALGLRWQDRGLPGKRLIQSTSDASFGVYLIHPLILQYLLTGAAAIGLITLAGTLPPALVLVLMVAVLVPLVYLLSGLTAAALRHTPASLALAGRARRRTPANSRKRLDPALATTGGMR